MSTETAVELTTIGNVDAMLSRAADLDAYLLVMGGRPRLTERSLLGVQASVPPRS